MYSWKWELSNVEACCSEPNTLSCCSQCVLISQWNYATFPYNIRLLITSNVWSAVWSHYHTRDNKADAGNHWGTACIDHFTTKPPGPAQHLMINGAGRSYRPLVNTNYNQGWARDVNGRDQDKTETLAPESETLTSPAETFKFRDETFAGLKTWPRRWNARCH